MNGVTSMTKRTRDFRIPLLVMSSLLAWIEGAALFLSSRSIGNLLPIPGMRFTMLFSHFLPWLISVYLALPKRERGSVDVLAKDDFDRRPDMPAIILLLTYIALLNVELPLTMALRAQNAMR